MISNCIITITTPFQEIRIESSLFESNLKFEKHALNALKRLPHLSAKDTEIFSAFFYASRNQTGICQLQYELQGKPHDLYTVVLSGNKTFLNSIPVEPQNQIDITNKKVCRIARSFSYGDAYTENLDSEENLEFSSPSDPQDPILSAFFHSENLQKVTLSNTNLLHSNTTEYTELSRDPAVKSSPPEKCTIC